MKIRIEYYPIYLFTFVFLFSACIESGIPGKEVNSPAPFDVMEVIPDTLPVSVKMAESIMKQFPHIYNVEHFNSPVWCYTLGLSSLSFLKLHKETNNEKYLAYVRGYSDSLIDENGHIKGYQMDRFNIDNVNSGKILFILYDLTQDERYIKAAKTIRQQVEWQPRTRTGGFWHKRIYPYQMWLDGLYMGAPFYAQYEQRYDSPESFNDIAHQFILIEEKTRDPKTGLLYHAWDESKIQSWSDPETGRSRHFWGRAIGWYAMALVDALDYFPKDHPKKKDMIAIIQRLAEALVKVQDEETGVWYQILDMPEREGNYREGSASAMFVYFMVKAIQKGYLDESYLKPAMKGYNGILEHLIIYGEDGQMSISPVCRGAGLGGKPYRDGSYEYYINEAKFDNDTKATGPFIMASLLIEEMGCLHDKL